ncbi:hypothetical protein MsAc7_01880 [Methanolapillus millepedarum]|uniref:Uncharacterized protein n=1 Tax=Methanolapillus millepedarum TaxID=3028296 RepID=A0AA96ZTK7_9EURY|nr:hypothetical protein MsAc7_01880 [Methanosarcinaceae archaeon Ac7]
MIGIRQKGKFLHYFEFIFKEIDLIMEKQV